MKTVPENRSSSGISPPSRACRYLAPATSKSYVHATGRSNSVGSVNPATRRRQRGSRETGAACHPTGRLTEQLVEALLLVGPVAPPLRFDADLAPQHQGVHGRAARLGDPHLQHDGRHGGVRLGPGPDDLEGQVVIGARLRTRSKKASMAGVRLTAAVEAPPQPAQMADQLVADVDRHDEALSIPVPRSGSHEERLDVGLQALRERGWRTTRSFHVSSGSSDSVAPAGPG